MLAEGEQVLIPPGTPPTFWNAGDGELRFITDVHPPGSCKPTGKRFLVWQKEARWAKTACPICYN